MKTLLKNCTIIRNKSFKKADFLVLDDRVLYLQDKIKIHELEKESDHVIDCKNNLLLPGFIDVHVHFREPGFSYKETIKTGSLAAARGGYTTCLTMPNLDPAPSTLESLNKQLEIIRKDSCIHIIPYATITMNQDGRSRLSDMEAMKDYVCGYSDDGKGIQTNELMKDAMQIAMQLDKIIVAHCEDESLLKPGGAIHDGKYAKENGFIGISSESEYKQVERDLEIAKKTGCKYHVCHVSTKESVELIRKAKKEGVNVTCETAPHYLILSEEDLIDDGRFKMNPPLRSLKDKEALRQGIIDGTIDMIATDHAPHSKQEKSKGLKDSAFGIVGLETAFPVLYTNLVLKDKLITLNQLLNLMIINPARRFNIPINSLIEDIDFIDNHDLGIADLTLIDVNKQYNIDSNTFLSKGKATPFDGYSVQGKTIFTIVNGKIVYQGE